MSKRKQAFVSTACACALVAQSVSVTAQDKPKPKPAEQTFERVVVEPSGNGAATFTVRTADPAGLPGGTAYAYTQNSSGVFITGQGGSGGGTFGFMAAESFDSKVVKGAPYSAESVTEFAQTLADGNRLTRRSSSMVYRDSQGRMRREQNAMPVGLSEWINTENMPSTTIISDPVEGATYVLDQKQRLARRSRLLAATVTNVSAGGTLMRTAIAAPEAGVAVAGAPPQQMPQQIKVSGGVLQGSALRKVQPPYPPAAKTARAEGAVQVQVTISEKGEVIDASVVSGHPLLREATLSAARQWQFKPTELGGVPVKVQGVLTFNFTLEDGGAKPTEAANRGQTEAVLKTGTAGMRMNFNRESLGKQMIEGIECEGTRMVSTIPAGQIGNERPLEIINERWYSPELQLTVMTKQSDPRYGETVFRLANLTRAEPDEYLFKVPSEYTIKDENFGFRVMEDKVRRPEER
ncbi:MAG: energy transducer TonB [Acidobacteria bacterium]|nr:energy transducer TonB [Acidobacteriota bacterium]MBI3427869.1 energy transducer TonB [Acidobacteriota bacterium]